jgi:hypothetical protein
MNFPPPPPGQTFLESADALLALVGEVDLGGELVSACRNLRDLAVEHDEVDARFYQAMDEVRRLLES